MTGSTSRPRRRRATAIGLVSTGLAALMLSTGCTSQTGSPGTGALGAPASPTGSAGTGSRKSVV